MLNVNALETEGRNIEITRTAVKETAVSQVSEVTGAGEASTASAVSERAPRYGFGGNKQRGL